MSDPQQPAPVRPATRPLTTEELAALYRRITGREPMAQEVENLRGWHESWRQKQPQPTPARANS